MRLECLHNDLERSLEFGNTVFRAGLGKSWFDVCVLSLLLWWSLRFLRSMRLQTKQRVWLALLLQALAKIFFVRSCLTATCNCKTFDCPVFTSMTFPRQGGRCNWSFWNWVSGASKQLSMSDCEGSQKCTSRSWGSCSCSISIPPPPSPPQHPHHHLPLIIFLSSSSSHHLPLIIFLSSPSSHHLPLIIFLSSSSSHYLPLIIFLSSSSSQHHHHHHHDHHDHHHHHHQHLTIMTIMTIMTIIIMIIIIIIVVIIIIITIVIIIILLNLTMLINIIINFNIIINITLHYVFTVFGVFCCDNFSDALPVRRELWPWRPGHACCDIAVLELLVPSSSICTFDTSQLSGSSLIAVTCVGQLAQYWALLLPQRCDCDASKPKKCFGLLMGKQALGRNRF